ncbi:SAM-dependent methyltransferase [Kitasatospora sp. NPDC048545]|uniref:SAM-dependent methyltransferase n=1 Tax=Kitasatospora sp. NPDC048545 TaxID=3157208 RepID=UPI003402E018
MTLPSTTPTPAGAATTNHDPLAEGGRVRTATAAGVYIPCAGKVLLVHHAMSDTWVLPGGKAEHESPRQCAEREAREELGVPVTVQRLLAVHHLTGAKPMFPGAQTIPGAYPCNIMIYLGEIDEADTDRIKVPSDELHGWAWKDPKDAASSGHMEETNAAGLLACARAFRTGGVAYLEDGTELPPPAPEKDEPDALLPGGSRIDLSQPSTARIIEALAGGTNCYNADRAVADDLLKAAPCLPQIVKAEQAYPYRVVEHALALGIRQFLDLGTTLPPEGPSDEDYEDRLLHHRARLAGADADALRFLYVANDPVVMACAKTWLDDCDASHVIEADLNNTAAALARIARFPYLDLSRPVAVTLHGVLHWMNDDEVTAAMTALRSTLALGSVVSISHATADAHPAQAARVGARLTTAGFTIRPRSREQVRALFDGLELLDPGVVHTDAWHPQGPVLGLRASWAGVAVKPDPDRSTRS